jgi:hypothetical protein
MGAAVAVVDLGGTVFPYGRCREVAAVAAADLNAAILPDDHM